MKVRFLAAIFETELDKQRPPIMSVRQSGALEAPTLAPTVSGLLAGFPHGQLTVRVAIFVCETE